MRSRIPYLSVSMSVFEADCAPRRGPIRVWRTESDSNARYLAVNFFSREVLLATQPSVLMIQVLDDPSVAVMGIVVCAATAAVVRCVAMLNVSMFSDLRKVRVAPFGPPSVVVHEAGFPNVLVAQIMFRLKQRPLGKYPERGIIVGVVARIGLAPTSFHGYGPRLVLPPVTARGCFYAGPGYLSIGYCNP